MTEIATMSDALQIERNGTSMIVRFVRPEIRNPLSVAVVERIHDFVTECASDSHITRVIFSGVREVFASGADLREIAALKSREVRDFALRGQSLMTKIASLPQTTVAAINGYCMGGALDLALACDWRVASPNAEFGHPGTSLGIITGWGGTQRLPRLIGTTNALELFFTASRMDARRALEIGLVDEIVEDPVAAALEKQG